MEYGGTPFSRRVGQLNPIRWEPESQPGAPQLPAIPSSQPITVADLERFAARTRSFMTPAILTFILYNVGWIPGAIANVYYNGEAKQAEKMAGTTLPGVGCLQTQFILLCLVPLGLLMLAGVGFVACTGLGLLGVGLGAAGGAR